MKRGEIMYVSARERNILELLLASQDGITVKGIAEALKVSTRTIHRDLQSIEDILAEYDLMLEKQAGIGVKLAGPEEKITQLQSFIHGVEPVEYTPEERQQLLLSILLQEGEPVKLYTLAKELSVTISTISNDLNKMNSWLQPLDLKIVRRRSYGIEIQGDEKQKRRALRRLITEQIGEEKLLSLLEAHRNRDIIQEQASHKLLHLLDTKVIQEVLAILHELREEGEYIADASFTGLVVHLSLAVDRIQKGESIEKNEAYLERVRKENEYDTAEKIVKRLEERLNIEIPEVEIGYVAMHLLGAKQGDEGLNLLQEDALDLTLKAKRLIEEVEEEVGMPLAKDTSLLEGLVSHLKPALFRIEQGMKIYNTLLADIKKGYGPLFSILQVKIEKVFPEYEMPEEEIGYLVMHFGSAMERARNKQHIEAVVVCSSGIGTSKLLATRLEREIPQISKVSHMSAFDINQDAISSGAIVISTVPLQSVDPYFLVNPFLSDKEVERIRSFISKKEWKTKNNNLENDEPNSRDSEETWNKEEVLTDFQGIQQVSSLINSLLETFEFNEVPANETVREIVKHISSHQEDKGWVKDKDSITEALLDREKKGGLAIPGTSLALFHTRSEDVLRPSFTVHPMKLPVILRGMDNKDTEVTRILLMLAPENWSSQGIELMSYISTLIIENESSIDIFENGNEQTLFSFLEKKLKAYLMEKLQ